MSVEKRFPERELRTVKRKLIVNYDWLFVRLRLEELKNSFRILVLRVQFFLMYFFLTLFPTVIHEFLPDRDDKINFLRTK